MAIKNRKNLFGVYGLWFLILIITLTVQLANWGVYARYDRDLISHGDYWLLFSAHFVHLNWAHWGLNMAGLAIVAFFFSSYGRLWHWLSVLLISALFVGVGLYQFHPEIGWYVGLSGVLHGLFIFGVTREIKVHPTSGYVLLILLVGKLVWEVLHGALPGSQDMTGGTVVTDAHLYGGVGGFISVIAIYVFMQIIAAYKKSRAKNLLNE